MPDAHLPRLPFERHDVLLPSAQVRALEEKGNIHRVRTGVGHEAWFVTGYHRVRALLGDNRLCVSHPDPDNAPRAGNSVLFGGPVRDFENDFEEHARMCRLIKPHFTPGRMREIRPRVEAIITSLLDGIEQSDPPVDIKQALAAPLGILVICELTGIPAPDQQQFQSWTNAATDTSNSDMSVRGLNDLISYGKQLVREKRSNPGQDFISRMCEMGEIGSDEIAETAVKLLIAGYGAIMTQLSYGILYLLTNPDQWRRLSADPGLIGAAVEEVLRIPVTFPSGLARYAREDLEVDGTRIAAGQLLLLDIGSGNHDPEIFESPDQFVVTRKDNRHLAFGYGRHYCKGAPLARLELTCLLEHLIPRFPNMRLAAPVSDLSIRSETITAELSEVPVRW